ncbi:PREDICTED: At3g27210 [Prunus dulcis]|uniref:PREDICTED: At3g27210 n=1 Tax=Prunus dulcis TaxID=3755 RepID=A0A5E4GDV6_PRUDU|nr:uncharacterized protein At3g27210-like [Prunus dulcis]KAI5351990.1 hypothetical protein L3X38_004881 [Prunus dulcis]VVA37718.1 PREDICTED: At3g27210 [Prunus dulcis]
MGNCGSVRKTQDSSPKSQLKCSSFSRTGCILTERPIQENTIRTVMPGASSLRELINGKEDMQFSSDPRLESDCEDFFSVNGDLTPSSTNTPIHQSSPIKSPATDVKKQLIELFHESFNDEAGHQDLHYESEAESSIFHLPQNSANKTPYESVADIVFRTVAISNANSEPRTRKNTQFAQCCLPKLVRSLSFSERKKR